MIDPISMGNRIQALTARDDGWTATGCLVRGWVRIEVQKRRSHRVVRATGLGARYTIYRVVRASGVSGLGYTLRHYRSAALANVSRDQTSGRPVATRHARSIDLAKSHSFATLRSLGEKFIDLYSRPSKQSWTEDRRKLRRDVFPVLGDVQATAISPDDIVRLLAPIYDRDAPIEADRTLGLIRQMFDWARREGHFHQPNPAAGIPQRTKESPRERVLSEDELGVFWNALGGPAFEAATADALRLQLLLGARSREVAGMVRPELMLEHSPPLWRLPIGRAAGVAEIARPLPPLALAIVRRRLAVSGEGPFVFVPSRDDAQPLPPDAPRRAISRAAQRNLVPSDFAPNDLRRTCRAFWVAMGIGPTVISKVLGLASPASGASEGGQVRLAEIYSSLLRWEAELLRIVSMTERDSVRASA